MATGPAATASNTRSYSSAYHASSKAPINPTEDAYGTAKRSGNGDRSVGYARTPLVSSGKATGLQINR